jgi:YidC/Oxa1 family membrane protein insertase
MHYISLIFDEALYRPLLNILVLFYEYIPGRDFGIAIICLTILIKLIFYPLGSKAIKSQKALADLQPKVKEIQEKYKNDKAEQGQKLLELYKTEKINPLSGCLPVLIQLPVLIALYRVFWAGLNPDQLTKIYSFIPRPETINSLFLGFLDLSKPNIILAIIVGISQYLQIKLITPKNIGAKKDGDMSAQIQKQMMYFTPVMMFFILLSLPSALGIYLLTTTLFTIAQQYFITKRNKTNI